MKTAVIHLLNENMSGNDIEYLQFFAGLKPVLTAKGYRLKNPAAVILRLEFGVRKEKQVSIKSTIDTEKRSHPADEPAVVPTTQYNRLDEYEKFITITAVPAGKREQPLWKTTVSLKDYASDFRSAQDKLLYLLSHFIERDSGRRISANLTDTEFYQRYKLNYSAAQASALFATEPEMRRRYLDELQKRVNARAADFKKCGLTETREIVFMVSPFGTLLSFDVSGTPVNGKVGECVAKRFESLLEPPHDLDTTQPMSVIIPVQ